MSMIPYQRKSPVRLGQAELYPLTMPEPSMGEVIDAFVQEAWFGVGTGYADQVSYDVEQKMISGTPIDEDSFNRDFSRFGISYTDGMTAEAAQELANNSIDRQYNQRVISSATSGDYFAGASAAFAAGVFEPKNLAYGIGTSLALGPFAAVTPVARSLRQIQQLRRAGQYVALSKGQYAALATGGAVEGMVSAAIMEPSNRDSAATLQQDYTMADSLWNVGLSTVLGAGLKTIPPFAQAKYDTWKGRTHEIVAHEIDLATEQLATGQKVDVSHVEKLAVGEVSKLPPAEKAAAVERFVKYTDTPEFKTRFEGSKVVDETGAPLRVYHGTSADFAQFDNTKTGLNDRGLWGRGHYFSGVIDNANSYALRQGEGARIIPAYISLKNPLVLKTGEDLVTRLPDGTNYKDLVGQNLDGSKIKAIAEANGHDGVIQIKPDGKIGDLVAYSSKQIIPAFGADDLDAITARLDAENQASLSQSTKESLSPYASTAIDKAAIEALETMPLADKPDYAKQYDSSIEKMRAMVDEGVLSKDEFDTFMDAVDNNNEADTLEALKDLETCLAGLV